jgi:hypothetical protein
MRDRVEGVHGRHCNYCCDVYDRGALGKCMAEFMHFGGLMDFWTSILCPSVEIG